MLNYFKDPYEYEASINHKGQQLTTEQLKSEMEITLKMAGLDNLYEIVEDKEYSIPLPIYNPKKIEFSWADAVYFLKRNKEDDSFALSHEMFAYLLLEYNQLGKSPWENLDWFDKFVFDLIGN